MKMNKLAMLLTLSLLILACKANFNVAAPEAAPETTLALKGELVELSPTFPHGLTLNDRVSTVSYTENYGRSVLAPDGSLYVLSDIKHSDSASNYVQYGYLSRITQAGVRDNNFGTSGITKIHSSFGDKENYRRMFLDNGTLTIAGHNWHVPGQTFYAAALKVNGTTGAIDTTYANASTGFFRKNITNRTYGVGVVKAIDGTNLHLTATNQASPHGMYLYKTDNSGQLITTFGTAGLLTTGITAHYHDYWKIYVDKDGNIFVGYLEVVASTYHISIVKFDPTGAIDTNFGVNGFFKRTLGSASYFLGDFVFKDNLLTFLSVYSVGSDWKTRIYRISSVTGALEATNGEIDLKDPATDEECYSSGMVMYKDKMIAQCYFATTSRNVIVAYNPDGSLDDNFGEDGFLDITNPNSHTTYDMILDDGRLNLWIVGTVTVANDVSKYIMKVKLSEIRIPKP